MRKGVNKENPEPSICNPIPATTPPCTISALPAALEMSDAPRHLAQPTQAAPMSIFQYGVLSVLNRDIGEEEHFLISLPLALKRLENYTARLKFQ